MSRARSCSPASASAPWRSSVRWPSPCSRSGASIPCTGFRRDTGCHGSSMVCSPRPTRMLDSRADFENGYDFHSGLPRTVSAPGQNRQERWPRKRHNVAFFNRSSVTFEFANVPKRLLCPPTYLQMSTTTVRRNLPPGTAHLPKSPRCRRESASATLWKTASHHQSRGKTTVRAGRLPCRQPVHDRQH